jgi:hypothetical protein
VQTRRADATRRHPLRASASALLVLVLATAVVLLNGFGEAAAAVRSCWHTYIPWYTRQTVRTRARDIWTGMHAGAFFAYFFYIYL